MAYDVEAEHPEVLMSKNIYRLSKNSERIVDALESIAASLHKLANPPIKIEGGVVTGRLFTN